MKKELEQRLGRGGVLGERQIVHKNIQGREEEIPKHSLTRRPNSSLGCVCWEADCGQEAS